jgi:hypothetical protein
MEDSLDVDIDDPELGEEIHLLSDLMVLASRSSESLEATVIDAVLLRDPGPEQGGPDGSAD